VFGSCVLVALVATWACGGSDQKGATSTATTVAGAPESRPTPATIRPEAFSDQITNPFFPLSPGTTFVFEGTKDLKAERNEVTVTHDTRIVMGVRCVVVHDVVIVDGEVHEDTYDWYAQDDAGNVWYFGEDSKELSGGEVISTQGSWEAGVTGAQPGIIMEADPEPGDAYWQEYYEGEAEDKAKVLRLDDSLSTPYGSFSGVLVTEETTQLEPDTAEQKYYAHGVGVVEVRQVKGGEDHSELVEVRQD
jgi:hypothetical protein